MSFNLTTFIFELINFVVLLVVLQRFLYRPLRRGIEARRVRLEGKETEATRLQEEARELLKAHGAQEAELRQLRDHIVQEATEEADVERGRILAQAREDGRAEHARLDRLLEAEREEALRWVQATAVEQSTVLAGRLLLALAPEAVHDALLTHLVEALEVHAPALREAMAEDGREHVDVALSVARMPDDATLDRLRTSLEGLLGLKVRFAVKEDDGLRAGFVVRVADRVFDGSIKGQLDAFRGLARTMLEPEAAHG